MLRWIIESVIEQDATKQLDRTFDPIARAISRRSVQGLGTDESLNRCSPRSRPRGIHARQWLIRGGGPRDGEDVAVGRGCKVSSGSWYDPYTTRTYTDLQEIDIDHVVPLAEAWRSERALLKPLASRGVRQRSGRAPERGGQHQPEKSDKGPEDWRPPNEAEWCGYATRWIGIKTEYGLSVDAAEKAALEEMLGACA